MSQPTRPSLDVMVPLYQVDYRAPKSGKNFGFTKRRVRFCFGYANPDAVRPGGPDLVGVDCRGEEHEISFAWSLTSGKRQVQLDGREIHSSITSRFKPESKFELKFRMPNKNHQVHLVAYASPPPSTSTLRQFDLFLNKVSFFELPRVYQLRRDLPTLHLSMNKSKMTMSTRKLPSPEEEELEKDLDEDEGGKDTLVQTVGPAAHCQQPKSSLQSQPINEESAQSLLDFAQPVLSLPEDGSQPILTMHEQITKRMEHAVVQAPVEDASLFNFAPSTPAQQQPPANQLITVATPETPTQAHEHATEQLARGKDSSLLEFSAAPTSTSIPSLASSDFSSLSLNSSGESSHLSPSSVVEQQAHHHQTSLWSEGQKFNTFSNKDIVSSSRAGEGSDADNEMSTGATTGAAGFEMLGWDSPNNLNLTPSTVMAPPSMAPPPPPPDRFTGTDLNDASEGMTFAMAPSMVTPSWQHNVHDAANTSNLTGDKFQGVGGSGSAEKGFAVPATTTNPVGLEDQQQAKYEGASNNMMLSMHSLFLGDDNTWEEEYVQGAAEGKGEADVSMMKLVDLNDLNVSSSNPNSAGRCA